MIDCELMHTDREAHLHGRWGSNLVVHQPVYDIALIQLTFDWSLFLVLQTTFDAEPSFDDEDVASTRYSFEAEQPAFGFTERDVDAPTSYHSRKSSAG